MSKSPPAAEAGPSTSLPTSLLSYPSAASEPSTSAASIGSQTRGILKDRLYIGNLHPTVDEYSLLQVFSKFGKVTKLDFLFHKTGPAKGKPRGFAFVEYGSEDEARKALSMANDKLLRGRKLVVTYANQAPIDQYAPGSFRPARKQVTETGRPTTLSMLKGGRGGRNEGTGNKIAMMEAKLRQMEAQKVVESAAPTPSSSAHPLPRKPSSYILPAQGQGPSAASSGKGKSAAKAPLPSLPIAPSVQDASRSSQQSLQASAQTMAAGDHPSTTRSSTGLVGVKINKKAR